MHLHLPIRCFIFGILVFPLFPHKLRIHRSFSTDFQRGGFDFHPVERHDVHAFFQCLFVFQEDDASLCSAQNTGYFIPCRLRMGFFLSRIPRSCVFPRNGDFHFLRSLFVFQKILSDDFQIFSHSSSFSFRFSLCSSFMVDQSAYNLRSEGESVYSSFTMDLSTRPSTRRQKLLFFSHGWIDLYSSLTGE